MSRKKSGMPLTIEYFRDRSIVDPTTGCWNWQKAKSQHGYGVMRLGGKTTRAHRASFICASGKSIGPDIDVCHKCDNRQCVNPDHLFSGSRAENMADCASKGRIKTPRLNGEDCPASRLTVQDVLLIRADTRSQRKIAASYGVDKGTIAAIKNGKTWRSV